MDIAALVSYLAPLLPQLLTLAVGDGEQNPGFAQQIWRRLRGRVEERPAAHEAVADLAADPDDEALRTVLLVQLRKMFAEDSGLAAEVGRLFAEAQQAGATGNVTNVNVSGSGAVGIGGNMSGGSITTGGH